MSLTQASLKKFLKQTKLVILSIEDDSSENTKVLKLTLAEPITAVGSNVTDSGAEMKLANVTTVYVAAEDIDKFMETAEEEGDNVTYEGSMKLDVSRPNGRIVNGAFQITKPSKVFLTAVAFNKRGNGLRQDRTAALSAAIAGIFGKVAENGQFIAPADVKATAPISLGGRPDVVDTNAGKVPAKAGA